MKFAIIEAAPVVQPPNEVVITLTSPQFHMLLACVGNCRDTDALRNAHLDAHVDNALAEQTSTWDLYKALKAIAPEVR